MLIRLLLLCGIAALTSGAAVLPGGEPLLPPKLSTYQFGQRSPGDATKEIVAVKDQPFAEALRIATLKKPAYPWYITLHARTIAPIRKGDVVLATLIARRIQSRDETGEARVGIVVEGSGGEHHKLTDTATSVGPEWARINASFVADQDFGAGDAQMSLRFGFEPQVIEVAAIAMTNFGKVVALKDLPRSTHWYAGWEESAPWRKAATERIEKIRKGDLTVSVTDANGHAVPGAEVSVRMTRQEFAFGSAVVAGRITDRTSADNERYRKIIETYFNKVVFENDLKWGGWLTNRPDGIQHRQQTLDAIDWLRARNIAIRGHVMVWPSWRNTPRFLQNSKSDSAALRLAIDEHITDQTSVLRGKLAEWDVINESYANHDIIDLLGREEMAHWFKVARQGEPQVKLFYNDYIMFAGSGPGSPNQFFFDTVKFLQEHGPIDGIGEQGHFGGNPTPPEKVLKAFDQFGALGLPIQISEFDIDTSDEELQSAYTRDFMTAAFSHPSVIGIVAWGFWEGAHWRPRGAMWAKDWTLRPNGKVWLDLVTKRWHTEATVSTRADGTLAVRGFCGDYEVVTRSGNRLATNQLHLPRSGAAATVVIR